MTFLGVFVNLVLVYEKKYVERFKKKGLVDIGNLKKITNEGELGPILDHFFYKLYKIKTVCC